MITRGIVELVVTPYTYKVRLPIFDSIEQASYYVSKENLSTAVLCSVKGVTDCIKEGDVVFVGFEDNSYSKPVILGQLYRQSITEENEVNHARLKCNTLTAFDTAQLPVNTVIGDVSYSELSDLITQFRNISDPGLQEYRLVTVKYLQEKGILSLAESYTTCQHPEVNEVTIPPSCTARGSSYTQCTNCGATLSYETSPMIPHTLVKQQGVDATCTTEGKEEHYVCTKCFQTFTLNETVHTYDTDSLLIGLFDDKIWTLEPIKILVKPALGHDYETTVVEASCTTAGYTKHVCTREGCGHEYIDGNVAPLGHNFTDWTITVTPTAENIGKQERTCQRCGLKEERDVVYVETYTIDNTTIDEDGNLIINYTNGTSTNVGRVVGTNGTDGVDGINGQDGLSAYLIWINAGNSGSEAEFLSSLKGDPGAPGHNGQNGQDGAPGKDGQDGEDGKGVEKTEIVNGELIIYYTDSTNVNLGKVVGENGQDGAPGRDGVNGEDGKDGVDGAPGKDGSDGVGVKDININDKGELVITYTDGKEVNLGVVVGKDGQDGENGTDGKDGVDGTNGTDGKDGVTPQLRINTETNEWEVSYDNGESWTSLGVKATGGTTDPTDPDDGGDDPSGGDSSDTGDTVCDVHTWNADTGYCTVCGKECDHNWTLADEGSTCSICGTVCNHEEYVNGTCARCGHKHISHNWNSVTGVCTICGATCQHTYDSNGTCSICGYHKPECEHSWVDGVCELCGAVCSHTSWSHGSTQSVCRTCGVVCTHDKDPNCVCTTCGKVLHNFDENGYCTDCNAHKHTYEEGNESCIVCDGYDTCIHGITDEHVCLSCCTHVWNNDTCIICGDTKPHTLDENGDCTNEGCDYHCEHESSTNGICDVCGTILVGHEPGDSFNSDALDGVQFDSSEYNEVAVNNTVFGFSGSTTVKENRDGLNVIKKTMYEGETQDINIRSLNGSVIRKVVITLEGEYTSDLFVVGEGTLIVEYDETSNTTTVTLVCGGSEEITITLTAYETTHYTILSIDTYY